MIELIVTFLICVGLLFHILGSIGLHRFYDVYTRAHASTLCTTFGSIGIIMSVVIYSILNGYLSLAAHSFIALLLILISGATGSHAITRAAYKAGIKPKLVLGDALAKVKK
ncbi:MAG: monovalent cation/H(+) antiporter subunit G [Candidatus Diapherotrites archaeon]